MPTKEDSLKAALDYARMKDPGLLKEIKEVLHTRYDKGFREAIDLLERGSPGFMLTANEMWNVQQLLHTAIVETVIPATTQPSTSQEAPAFRLERGIEHDVVELVNKLYRQCEESEKTDPSNVLAPKMWIEQLQGKDILFAASLTGYHSGEKVDTSYSIEGFPMHGPCPFLVMDINGKKPLCAWSGENRGLRWFVRAAYVTEDMLVSVNNDKLGQGFFTIRGGVIVQLSKGQYEAVIEGRKKAQQPPYRELALVGG